MCACVCVRVLVCVCVVQEDIENSKKDWELARLKALKEEEERRARMEEDEMLYTYVRDDAQVKRRLAKAGKVKKGPGRPRIHHPPPPSPSLSTSDTGSVEARPAPSRVRNRVVVKKEPLPVGGRGRGRKKMGNGEAKAEVGRRKRGQGAKAAVKVENDKPVENGPTPKAPPKPRGRRNNIARKTIHNGEATPEEVKDANSKKDPQKVAVVRLNSDDATVKTGEGTPAPKGRGVGRPRGSGRPVGRPPGSSSATPRAILKVPSMATTQAGAGMGLTPPPRNKSPAAVTSPVSSPGNVPPPWSNPNLVIRTRRANLHSPVQVSGRQVVQGVPSLTQQQAGLLQPTGLLQQGVGVVQSGGLVRLVSPGPVVALAASQPLQVVNAGRIRPSASIPAAQLSLAGARVLTTSGQQVVNAGGLAGVRVLTSSGQQVVTAGSLAGARVLTTSAQQVVNTGELAATRVLNSSGQQVVNAGALSGARVLNTSSPQVVSLGATLASARVLNASTPQVVNAGASIAGVRLLNSSGQPVVNAGGSLGGARLLNASGQPVVNAGSLQGSIVRMPDGSTAVLGQIGASNLLGAQPAGSPRLIVSGTNQSPLGARALLASNLAAARPATPRLTAPSQVVNAAGIRTVQLGAGGLTAPLTLRGVGGVPMGVNLVKAGASGVQIPIVGNQAASSGVSIPIVGGQGLALRGGQIIQTVGQNASPQSFVLITPRAPAPASAAGAAGSGTSSVEKKGAG